jgi:hypothetical protein
MPERKIGIEIDRLVLDRISASKRLDFRWLDHSEKQDIKRTFEELYLTEKLSTTEIARELGKSQYFVWGTCKKLGIELRTRDEGKALSAPLRIRTLRRPFSGSAVDRYYLKGFSEGDLDVRKPSTTAVMISSTTTHPAFSSCFTRLFRDHGPIYLYPVYDAIAGYRWKLATRLDNSFSFMLPTQRKDYPALLDGPDYFYSWLAGVVDSDGSIILEQSGVYVRLTLLIANQNLALLHHIKGELANGGYFPTGPYLQASKGKVTSQRGIRYTKNLWNICLQRAEEVRKISSLLPLRHEEKINRKELTLKMPPGARWEEYGSRILALRNSIRLQVSDYVSKAELAYKKRVLGQAT